MKYYYTIICAVVLSGTYCQAQDTLRNLLTDSLVAFEYEAPGWGYFLGHNHNLNEEYAERYAIEGTGAVVGVISHHTGVNTNNNMAEFNVYAVGSNNLPDQQLGSHEVPYRDLDLSGNAMTTMFDKPVVVTNQFYVAFNLNDYAHGGFEGDIISLMSGPDLTRSTEDLANFGRNVIRRHNHGSRIWRDFYTQNFTPMATHFAIFPIVDFTITSITAPRVTKGALTLYPAVYDGASNETALRFSLGQPAETTIRLVSLDGKPVLEQNLGWLPSGDHNVPLLYKGISAGIYVYSIQVGNTLLASRVMLQ